MDITVNQEVINDTAKLMIHRLVARALARDPSLIEGAKTSHKRARERFPDRTFVRRWNELLASPLSELRLRLVSRDRDMDRLRLSSPFATADGFDFTEPVLRRRIWAAARRLAVRAVNRRELDRRPG
jgi:hypothetical protein